MHFEPAPARPGTTLLDVNKSLAHRRLRHVLPMHLALCVALCLMLWAGVALAQTDASNSSATPGSTALDALQSELALGIVTQAAQTSALPGARVQVQLGALDPRLRLAPCQRSEAYLPAGARLLGRTRVGLRCVQGPTLWNVTLPVTVAVYAPAVVLRDALPAGTKLSADHLTSAEIDWGAAAGQAHASAAALIGRELGRPLAAGAPVLATDIKQRQWFAAGETVQVRASGTGFAINTDATALSHGIEGQPVRVRTDSGRVLSGRAVSDRLVEVAL